MGKLLVVICMIVLFAFWISGVLLLDCGTILMTIEILRISFCVVFVFSVIMIIPANWIFMTYFFRRRRKRQE
ncbi:MAG: hypothetical protein A2312_03775 [Candidatus Staskawiczbacteria bacterium RIFOXYB2_FULL_32_9]|nr:MAG: hypothetical protein UR22_C0002G0042 [Parcubacteria group bacterium GW2011_GWC2_32_10]OGZ82302.1 MAG: hypothetical protein A2312_03775 [Candidatus Staskawiczbacteria bacterium RIFOXYB2_FULL_32_9]OGZ86884.1 MAG: hypothetical protein A2463_01905 [Candidatus Staskawiczbacteria bacterium RIFOXYC2_FULL_32_10]